MMEKFQRLSYNGTLQGAGREEHQRIAGEDWLSKKWGEAEMN
jgi:predicted secreted hydrolase